MPTTITQQRKELQRNLIGTPIPRLWCPPITHYQDDGPLDAARQAAHWTKLVTAVGGFLVPGSTGDGWEMTEDEIDALLDNTLNLCAKLNTRILISVLRTELPLMLDAIERTLAKLKARTGYDDPLKAMRTARVCGFTVCPPSGETLTQMHLKLGLGAILNQDVPVAIYQLPQITHNEVNPNIIAELAEKFPNFILFKDSSGTDQVALSDKDKSGVFLVRGAEGDYAIWLQESDGPYHGLLLSTANSFPAQLGQMIALLEAGQHEQAHALSTKLTDVANAVFAFVAEFPHGNTFANANKAIDHWMAYGAQAGDITPPMLHAGVRLPESVIAQTGKVLTEAGWLPAEGYL